MPVYTRRFPAPATPRPPSVVPASEDEDSPAAAISSPGEGPALALAAGLVENLTPVVPHLGTVVLPSVERRVVSGERLSPVRTPRGRTRERSAGAAVSPLPASKKLKGKQRAVPLATTDFNWFPPASPRTASAQPSPGLTLRVPGGRMPGRASSLPPASSFAMEALTAFNRLTAGLDLQDPLVRSQVRHAFREHAQWLDVEALLAPPAQSLPVAPPGFPPLPSTLPAHIVPLPRRFSDRGLPPRVFPSPFSALRLAPHALAGVVPPVASLLLPSKAYCSPTVLGTLPLPSSRMPLPGVGTSVSALGIGSAVATAPRLLPAAPVQLNGNTLPEAKAVATALRNNWLVHIPLSALSTKVLLTLGSSSRSQADHDQSLSVREGVLTVSAPHLDGKSEGDMSYEDWCHAWPRLVSMIRRYLPGAGAGDIANAWESHFTSLYARYDFFANFRRYLRYDIRLRQAFVHDHSFNPAHWQTEVYEAVGRDFDSRVSSGSFPAGSRTGGQSASFRSDPAQKSSASSAARTSSQPFTQHKCIFCGRAECRGRACGTVKTAFVTFDSSTNIFTSSAGEQVCYKFNGARGCKSSESDCGRRHLCIRCGGAHSSQVCTQ
ncbi:hypothetical protein P692DRAFT_20881257 [Suillus brevipes Sb2]|nr:hypothetical protein P692DRAFT_20881257 [Suillus brevipes Sb2]